MQDITTHDVRITTGQVEIHALKVGPKPMTESIFRQLVLYDLLDAYTAQMRGQPWGWVNYWWERCGADWGEIYQGDVLHVVWQDGAMLKRSVCARNNSRFPADSLLAMQWAQHWATLSALPQLFIAV